MATTVLVGCECGNRFSVFVPKVKQWAAMGVPDDLLDYAREIDTQEAVTGELILGRLMAEKTGAQHVDGASVDVWTCDKCGRRGQLVELFPKVTFSVDDIEDLRQHMAQERDKDKDPGSSLWPRDQGDRAE